MDHDGKPGILSALEHLVIHGWIPLRQMSSLLSLNTPTGIYQRQRGQNRIETIKVGGTHRVYEDEVIRTLKNEPEKKQGDAQLMLRLYRTKQDVWVQRTTKSNNQ